MLPVQTKSTLVMRDAGETYMGAIIRPKYRNVARHHRRQGEAEDAPSATRTILDVGLSPQRVGTPRRPSPVPLSGTVQKLQGCAVGDIFFAS
jgi:hypothetical protein